MEAVMAIRTKKEMFEFLLAKEVMAELIGMSKTPEQENTKMFTQKVKNITNKT
jgi:hypothetical protein